MTFGRWLASIVVLGTTAFATPAFADAIDGNWCSRDGRTFSIRGPRIVTPGGREMEGNYSRHWFSYTAPAAERGSGSTIFMNLAGEDTVFLRYGEMADSPSETWTRCSPSVSSLDLFRRG